MRWPPPTRRPLMKRLKATKPRPATAQWGLFLRNHDELDLGRLTKTQRQNCVRKLRSRQEHAALRSRHPAPAGADAAGRSAPARTRLQPDVTLPGTPVIRYGDEIGMGDNLDLPERNCARTPMQWSTEPHAGFTESDKPVLPVITKGPYGYEHVNVAQRGIPTHC